MKAHRVGFEGQTGVRLRRLEDGDCTSKTESPVSDQEARCSAMFGEQVAPSNYR